MSQTGDASLDANGDRSADDAARPIRLADHTSQQKQLRMLLAARDGDRVAFGDLVRSMQDRLYNAVFRIVGNVDDALELTQEALMKALEKVADFRGECAAYTWVFRIAMNLSISRLRSAKVRKAFSIDADSPAGPTDQMTSLRKQLFTGVPGPPQQAEHGERLGMVARAMGELNPRDRTLLVMRDVDGMEYAEMAHVLDVPLGTLKSQLFRARMALRARYEAMDR